MLPTNVKMLRRQLDIITKNPILMKQGRPGMEWFEDLLLRCGLGLGISEKRNENLDLHWMFTIAKRRFWGTFFGTRFFLPKNPLVEYQVS